MEHHGRYSETFEIAQEVVIAGHGKLIGQHARLVIRVFLLSLELTSCGYGDVHDLRNDTTRNLQADRQKSDSEKNQALNRIAAIVIKGNHHQGHHLARLVGKVVRFQHEGSHSFTKSSETDLGKQTYSTALLSDIRQVQFTCL